MSERPRREISDPTTMRALAHPVRLALIDALRDHGELTASRAAELLADSPGNMSWHLQTLAKYGFVEEAGTGKGRSRPWRLIQQRWSFGTSPTDDPDELAASDALEHALLNRSLEQLQTWQRRRSEHPEWQGAFINNQVAYLTPDELAEVAAEMERVLRRFDARADPAARPSGAAPVKVFAWGHPLEP